MKDPITVGDVFRMMSELPADYERKRKVCLIEDVAKVEKLLGYPPIGPKRFDRLYDADYKVIYEYYQKLRGECATKYINLNGQTTHI